MKKIILVHGINNQHKSSEQIKWEWLGALSTVLSAQQENAIRNLDVVAPYYGDILYDYTEGREADLVNRPVAQSIGNVPDEETEFYNEFLADVAQAFDIGDEDIAVEMGHQDAAVKQGFFHDRKFIAIVQLLEKISPWQGKHVMRVLSQAYTYINDEDAAAAVDAVVQPELEGEPSLILAHSLGTIVTYKILRDLIRDKKHKFLTLGSPLGIKAVRNGIGPKFSLPTKSVSDWSNGLDKDDFVSFKRKLKNAGYEGDIREYNDINNGGDDPHSIQKYLTDHWVRRTILDYIGVP